MLILKGEEIPPRYTDGDPPVDLVLYEILEKDLRRMPAQGTPTARATEMLNSYQAPPKKNEPRLNPKVASDRFSDEAPPNLGTLRKNGENIKNDNAKQSSQEFKAMKYGAIIVIILALSWIAWRFAGGPRR